jgi:hypothetical protein
VTDGLLWLDSGDRLVIATAMELGRPMVTYDARITSFAATHGRRYGFSAVSEAT